MVTGLGGGIMWLIMYCSFALAFWYGVKLIQEEEDILPVEKRDYTPGILVIVSDFRLNILSTIKKIAVMTENLFYSLSRFFGVLLAVLKI